MILVKTETGQQVFKDRSMRLTPRQRSAFIMFDGKRSVREVLEAGVGICREDIDQMLELGLLGQVGGAMDAANASAIVASGAALQPLSSAPPSAGSLQAAPARSAQQRYKDAYPIATQITGSLGLMGFRLNLSVEGTSNYEELLALIPKIRAAVGPGKMQALDRALGV